MFPFSRAKAPSSSSRGKAKQPSGSEQGASSVSPGHASVPVGEGNRPTSVGSAYHSMGKCKPCTFMASKRGCTQGIHCRFCHMHRSPADSAQQPEADRPEYTAIGRKFMERLQSGEVNPELLTGTEISYAVASESDMRSKLLAQLAGHTSV
mmetsp:Transcript_32126/g.90403  ORF Transcript_32126/g.90403 Transcript_32126/m.90403 type:complete len:151 (+) Transcript_32126:684-1136(+)